MRSARVLTLLSALLAPAVSGGQVVQVPDPLFDASVKRPAYHARRPRVLIDGAHANLFTETRRIQRLADLLASDGYEVAMGGNQRFTSVALSSYDVLIIATARGGTEAAQQTLPAFTSDEVDALIAWIGRGGALLLLADHFPFDKPIAGLAERLGVILANGVLADSVNEDWSDRRPRNSRWGKEGWIVYEGARLGSHPILRGREPSERVKRVLVFAGTSLHGPKGSVNLLRVAATARNQAREGVPPVGLGTSQGLAFQLGKGRVVVLADATMLSAQRITEPGVGEFVMGLSRADVDNRQLALNIVRWLTRIVN